MQVYLMRHGIPVSGPGVSDRERPLSPEGIAETQRAGEGLAAIGVHFDRIFTSPLVRAVQTAELVARSQPAPVALEEMEELAGGVVPEVLFRALGPVPSETSILLVGHEPDMSTLAAALIGAPAEHPIPFGRGSVARIDVDGPPLARPGRFVWLLTARLAGALAD